MNLSSPLDYKQFVVIPSKVYVEGAFYTIGGWANTAEYGYVDEICQFRLEENEWSVAGTLQENRLFYFSDTVRAKIIEHFTANFERKLETQVVQFLLMIISLLSVECLKQNQF